MNQNLNLVINFLRIRLSEEKVIEIYPFDPIQSTVHLFIGQEAVAKLVCPHLKPSDWFFVKYRDHAFHISKSGLPLLSFAELMGRRTGSSKGRAEPMYLASPEQGIIEACQQFLRQQTLIQSALLWS